MTTQLRRRPLVAAAAFGLAGAIALPAAAAPGTFTYVGELTDAVGFVDDEVDVTISVHDEAVGGAALWEQAIPGVEVLGGLFRVEIGLGSAQPVLDALIDRTEVWIELAVEGTPLEPRQQLTAAGYAMVAERARRLGGVLHTDYLRQDELAAAPARAGTAAQPPTAPEAGELWYDGTQQVLFAWDDASGDWQAITTSALAADNLPPNGIDTLSNGALSNEFTNVSHLWATGAPIEDATAVGPGNPAVAEVAVDEAAASYIYGLRVFTNFNLESANIVTMTLYPPPGMGVDPIVLRDGQLSFGTYGDAWTLDNTPALADLLGLNPSGVWTLAVVDQDNNLASPAVAGTLNSFEVRYDVVRADRLRASALVEAQDLVADVVVSEAEHALASVETTSDLMVVAGEAQRALQHTSFNNYVNSSGNISGRTLQFTKRRDDTTLMITYSDSFRHNTTSNRYIRFHIDGEPCRNVDNQEQRFYRTINSTSGYRTRPTTLTCFCDRAANIGDGSFIPAGTYTLQLWFNSSGIIVSEGSSAGSITVEEVFVD